MSDELQSDHFLVLLALVLRPEVSQKQEIARLVHPYIRSPKTVSLKLAQLEDRGYVISTQIGRRVVYKVKRTGQTALTAWRKSDVGKEFGGSWAEHIQEKELE
ncbi:MAG: hypothetical protein ACFFFG_11810 [Candidatus Thorarchaeota archaeon]